mgnify:CR=1 FL=1
MREKINKEVAMVEEEYKAGRLRWTYEDVSRLILPHPVRKGDDVLEAIGEYASLDEDDDCTPYEAAQDACGEDESDSAVAESGIEEEDDMGEEGVDVESGEVEHDPSEHDSAGLEVDLDVCEDGVPGASSVAVARPALSEAQAGRWSAANT